MGFPVKKEECGSVIYVTKESDGAEGDVLIDADGSRYVKAPELGEVAPEPEAPEAADAEEGLDEERVEATGHEPEKEASLKQDEAILHAETLAEQGGLDAPERSDVRVAVAEGADSEDAAEEAVVDESVALSDVADEADAEDDGEYNALDEASFPKDETPVDETESLDENDC